MEDHDQEHEVYGGEIPADDMDADVDLSARHDGDGYGDGDGEGYDDANSKVSPFLLSLDICPLGFWLIFFDL